MDKTYILAIDNGTQSVRALLFDLHGNLVDKSQVGIDSYRSPEPGWVENDAEAFWQSLCTACQRLWANTRVPKASVAGLVITTQRGTLVPLDANSFALAEEPGARYRVERDSEGRVEAIVRVLNGGNSEVRFLKATEATAAIH